MKNSHDNIFAFYVLVGIPAKSIIYYILSYHTMIRGN